MVVHLSDLTQLRTGEGMSDKGGLAYAEGIEDRDIVACPGLDVVALFPLAGWKEASTGHADDMKIIRKLEGQWIIDVRVVTQPGEQHYGLGLSARQK